MQNRFDVKIVESGLEEDDASGLEQNLIQKWGKRSENSGSLINNSDGGDTEKGLGVVVGFGILFPEGPLDFDFKMLGGKDRTNFANDLIEAMENLENELEPWLDQDDLPEAIDELHDELSSVKDCAVKYLKRQMGSENMALNLQGSYDGVIVDLHDFISENDSNKVAEIIHKAQRIMKQFYDRMGIKK